jgi:hypothetical protein
MDHHAVADQVLAIHVNHPTWQQVERVLFTFNHECVPSIGAPIEASTELRILSEDIDKFPLAFVTPLSSEDNAEL